MYKLINENQNKNALKDEYDKLVLSISSTKKLNNEETELYLYEDFNKDIINYISSNIVKMNELSKNKNNKIDLNSYLKTFIDKFLDLLDMNALITSNSEYYNLIYTNIALLIIEDNSENKYCFVLFFKVYLSYLNSDKENYIYYRDKINKLGMLIKQLNSNIPETDTNENIIDNSNILYQKIYNSFIQEFLPIFINNFIENNISKNRNICLFDIINNFIFCYDNIIHEISIKYFSLYDELNWRKKYLQTLCDLLLNNLVKNKKSEFKDDDIKKICEIIKAKNFIILNKIQSLLFYNENLFNNYFDILIKSIEKYLTDEIEKEDDY